MMVCVIIEIFRKLNVRKRKKNAIVEPYTVTIVGKGKSIHFHIFVKVGYYPLLPLACPLVYWFILLLCILYDHALSLSFELFDLT